MAHPSVLAASLSHHSFLALSLLLNSLPKANSFEQCVPIKEGPYSRCSLAGYNETFPLPTGLSIRALESIQASAESMIKTFENCSVGAISETMACAFIAPKCNKLNVQPVFPCKRVCSEFLKRCENSLPDFFIHILVALCSLLPDGTPKDGNCYEPANFNSHYNSSQMGPLERSCSPLIIPFCQNLDYTHTVLSHSIQKKLYVNMYGKEYSNDSRAAIPRPGSGAQSLINITKSMPKCEENVKKLFCAEYVPPCFLQEGIAYYTACQDVCTNVSIECQDVFYTQLRFFFYCEKLAYGDPYKGFCKHKSWPSPMKWIDIFQDLDGRWPQHRSKTYGVGTAAMAIIIAVPVAMVIFIIVIFYFYKRRKRIEEGYASQRDDKVELVT